MLMIGSRLDHLAIHVADRREAEITAHELLGHQTAADIAVPGENGQADLRVMTEAGDRFHLVLCDARDAGHPIARWVQERGPGIHHLAHRVDDLHGAIEQTAAAGGRVVGNPAEIAALRQAFIEITEDGILHELIQRDGDQIFAARNVADLIDAGVRGTKPLP